MFEYLPELMKGLHTSLTLTVASLIVALILALIFTIILTLKTPVLLPLASKMLSIGLLERNASKTALRPAIISSSLRFLYSAMPAKLLIFLSELFRPIFSNGKVCLFQKCFNRKSRYLLWQ